MAPAEVTSSGRRKRAQPHDELASPTDAASSPNSGAAIKRRRVGALVDSSPSTPKGFSAITSAIGGVLNRFGRRAGTWKEKTATASAYEVAGSDSADDVTAEPELLSVKSKKPVRTASVVKPSPKKNVYDVPESDDENEPDDDTDELDQEVPTTPSRRHKVTEAPTSTPKRSASAHQSKTTVKKPTTATVQHVPSRGDTTLRRRGRPPKNPVKVDGPAIKRSFPRKAGHAAARADAPQLKGILTPQRKKVGRPRKIVAFNEGDKENTEVYFEDIQPKRTDSVAAEEPDKAEVEEVTASDDSKSQQEDDEDEEVCAICSEPDSEPPNEIVFCEHCDMAVHQKCYNVPVIPDGDWLCRSCLQEDAVPASVRAPAKSKVASKKATETPDIPNFEKHLQRMQRVLLDRCSGVRRIRLRGQDEAYEKAFQLVEQTVVSGEGNSMMVIGARGSGKSTLVGDIVSDLKVEHQDEFHVVRLNGFIHTDDKLALKEIWRQLGKEMDIEDDLVNKTNNYADTMASLLALLSHPTEITGTEEGVTSKSVIFVIDEFDLFATHARQTLLYNLFDIAQARKAPIAVLGLTARIDVVESLEKRVKSRFSHRYVYLSLPKTLVAYWDVCKQGLCVDEGDLQAEGFETDLKGLNQFRDYWEQKIEALRETPDFADHLEYHYYAGKSVPAFFTSCILPLSVLSASSLDLEISSPLDGPVSLEPAEPKLGLLAALSDLELAMLISAARLDIVAHTDTVNFAMAYDEYSTQMSKQRVQSASSGMMALGGGARIWGRRVASVAWERLVSLGLLIPAGIGGRSNAAHGGLEGKMWKLDVALEEIPSAVELPGFLGKWCSQI
ncbi:origin recognition complex subunit 4 C-terminus-domain-containing protein [Xylariomycetidae sp. FL0641]|nr:origin recognition complex subunit 4 C-terminus-domain-containing protein [Xylariomycetidae sp. FL0641]